MRARSILFSVIGEFLRFFLFLLNLPSKEDIGLNGLSEIKIPDLYLRQKGRNNGVISFFGLVAVDGADINFEPLDIKWKS